MFISNMNLVSLTIAEFWHGQDQTKNTKFKVTMPRSKIKCLQFAYCCTWVFISSSLYQCRSNPTKLANDLDLHSQFWPQFKVKCQISKLTCLCIPIG